MKKLIILAAVAALAVLGLFATGCEAESPPRAEAAVSKQKANAVHPITVDVRDLTVVLIRAEARAVLKEPIELAAAARPRFRQERSETPIATRYSHEPDAARPPNLHAAGAFVPFAGNAGTRAREKV